MQGVVPEHAGKDRDAEGPLSRWHGGLRAAASRQFVGILSHGRVRSSLEGVQGEDFTEKLWEYNRIPSIAHYVVLEQTEPRAYIYNRSGAGDFILAPVAVRGMDGVIELPALELVLPMVRAYANVTFPEDVDPESPPPSPSP